MMASLSTTLNSGAAVTRVSSVCLSFDSQLDAAGDLFIGYSGVVGLDERACVAFGLQKSWDEFGLVPGDV
jgi:hypothetical protein